MQMPRLALSLALVGVVTQSAMAEQQTSIHIKIASGDQLRGTKAHRNAKSGAQTCGAMYGYDWEEFEYACQWNHGIYGYNLYFKRYDGTFVYECLCDDHLGTYDPWDASVWTWSKTDGFACYTRDGKTYDEVEHEFDSVSCEARNAKYCDTASDSCEDFLPDNMD